MGKVKVKKKDARIDMTAMSDVTVLLLTFFMLTSTFLQKEPVQVITPPSISEAKVPDTNLMTILVSQKGQVFMELVGDVDSTKLSSESLRIKALHIMAEKHGINFTNDEYNTFKKLNAFGVPMNKMKEWLDMKMEDRDKNMKDGPGIPIELTEYKGKETEFQEWIMAVAQVMEDAGLDADIRSGKGIAIKADGTTQYQVVEVVMNNLQSINRNKFTLMTALKQEED